MDRLTDEIRNAEQDLLQGQSDAGAGEAEVKETLEEATGTPDEQAEQSQPDDSEITAIAKFKTGKARDEAYLQMEQRFKKLENDWNQERQARQQLEQLVQVNPGFGVQPNGQSFGPQIGQPGLPQDALEQLNMMAQENPIGTMFAMLQWQDQQRQQQAAFTQRRSQERDRQFASLQEQGFDVAAIRPRIEQLLDQGRLPDVIDPAGRIDEDAISRALTLALPLPELVKFATQTQQQNAQLAESNRNAMMSASASPQVSPRTKTTIPAAFAEGAAKYGLDANALASIPGPGESVEVDFLGLKKGRKR